jgi:hypothetical protein
VQALKPLIEEIFLSSTAFKEEVIAKLGREFAANQVQYYRGNFNNI